MNTKLFFTIFAALVSAGIVLHWILNKPKEIPLKGEIGFHTGLKSTEKE